MLLSVIVPVYNVKPYLEKCVDSILAQTMRDLEIILVDDGSTDGSGTMCDEYALKDSRIVVIHQQNKGLSGARNTGIDAAKGDVIGFVDSDDWIDPDMYETLMKDLIRENADIAMCRSRRVKDDGTVVADHGTNGTFVTENVSDAIEFCLEWKKNMGLSVWSKIFRIKIFEHSRFKLGVISEDTFLLLELLEQGRRFVMNFASKYNYAVRDGSITMVKKYSDHILDTAEASEQNARIIAEKYPGIKTIGDSRKLWAERLTADRILRCQDAAEHMDKVRELQQKVRADFFGMLLNPHIFTKQKIVFTLFCLNIPLYFSLRKLFKRNYG